MTKILSILALACLLVVGAGCELPAESDAANASTFSVPVAYHKLDNGLRVILSPDNTSPTVAVAVYYNIGFRIEPRDRTGFAHLFEHMMFQGSQKMGKNEFIQLVQSNGGILNGSTRFDFTNYFEVLPSHKLETALWAEADRMRGLDITQENLTNQQDVVMNEVKVNVINQPYGGFPWLDMPQYANENWYNAHNFYGDFEDLQAANLEDVQSFFDTYYAPNNAALSIVGDFDPEEALPMIERLFGDIPSSEIPARPDISEPEQTAEKSFTKTDKLATRPALAFSYHMPERNTPEYYAMGLIDQIMLQGDDSKLHQKLVQEGGLTGNVNGGINLLGNMFNYDGPMLWTVSLFHDDTVPPDTIMAAVDEIVTDLQNNPVDQETLDRALVKLRSSLYDDIGGFFGIGRADLLASFALFDDNPARINQLEDEFRKVTPEMIQQVARQYLRTTNRTKLMVVPENAEIQPPVG